MQDTIYAVASGRGKAGVAVLRVSGPAAAATLAALSGRAVARFPPRRACRALLRDPSSGDALDDALAIRFPGPASYTGEDLVELHLHGGAAVVAATLRALGARPGLRMAEPGEFTRRAFLAGKLDLTAVEGIADLIDAESEAQRRQALRQAGGALTRLYGGWAEQLTRALAHLEASIDFVDEALPEGLDSGLWAEVAALREEIAAHLNDGGRGERLRAGLRLAILGRPNAGKSSLLNRLVARDAAIVSSVPGTTRDVIELHLEIEGFPVLVADTAGLRESADPVEAEGVRRARAWAATADLRVLVLDGTTEAPVLPATGADTLVAVNKCDAWTPAQAEAWDAIARAAPDDRPVCLLSLTSGEGWDAFQAQLAAAVAARCALGDAPVVTRARHREALGQCLAALERGLATPVTEIAAEELRSGLRCLGRITGRVDVEALLDVIFREFCIGK